MTAASCIASANTCLPSSPLFTPRTSRSSKCQLSSIIGKKQVNNTKHKTIPGAPRSPSVGVPVLEFPIRQLQQRTAFACPKRRNSVSPFAALIPFSCLWIPVISIFLFFSICVRRQGMEIVALLSGFPSPFFFSVCKGEML